MDIEDQEYCKMTLEEFLKNRGISDNDITYFNEQKIDCQAICAMTDEDLKQLLPAYGDRVAVKNFAKRSLSTGKQSLIERLKEKINIGKSVNDKSSSNNKSQPTRKMKQTRIIEIGWLCMSKIDNRFKQVRAKNGGGTRRVTIEKNSKCSEVLHIAKELFFPNGKSVRGKLTNFQIELVDYKSHIFDMNLTIQEMYELAALPTLRFYLATSKLSDESDEDEEDIVEILQSENAAPRSSPLNLFYDLPSTSMITDESYEENTIQSAQSQNVVRRSLRLSQESSISQISLNGLIAGNEQDNQEQSSGVENFDDNFYLVNEHDIESMSFQELLVLKEKMVLHRSNIFDELIEAFGRNQVDLKNVQMELILNNGESEMAHDDGGVLRDVLSEFWAEFYEKCTVGTTFKVPYIRHDYAEREWSIIARIFVNGWFATEYFPIKLAPIFILTCLGQNVNSEELVKNFLLFISDVEAEMLKKALKDFDEVDEDDLVDFFSLYKGKWLPSKENLQQLITDIAHQELVQKPAFVTQCFSAECKTLSEINVHDIYKKLNPSAKNILSNIEISELDSKQIEIFGFLKKYIKECDKKTRSNFLRYCSGSDIIHQKIKVTFNTLDGFARRPIGHTCSGLIEIPMTYKNFLNFRNDFNKVLNSNV